MDLKNLTAHVMVRNESYFISSVLYPLVKHLARVIVFDTGSTDGTENIARECGALVVEKGASSRKQLGEYRTEMSNLTDTDWTFLVDGDELYPESSILALSEIPMGNGKSVGFTPMVSVDWHNGDFWIGNDNFSRLSILPRGARYKGEYPFEVPYMFDDPNKYFYFEIPLAYHLHRLDRSPNDSLVQLRKQKQKLFSLGENPNWKLVSKIRLPLIGDDPYSKGLIK